MNEMKQAEEVVELLDRGAASEVTQGLPMTVMFELGTPPFNKLFLF